MKQILLLLIKFYQTFLSPLMGSNCRFYPTCSHYTYKAIETHGALRGSWLGAKRILRCNPFNPGGFDPVPGVPLNLDTDHVHGDTDPIDIRSHEAMSSGTDALTKGRGE